MNDRFKIDSVAVNITTPEQAVKKAESCSPAYVCGTNVRARYNGNHDENLCPILNNTFLTVPDGKPLEWYAHLSGLKMVRKSSGSDIFNKICQLTQNTKLTHFFMGVHQKLL